MWRTGSERGLPFYEYLRKICNKLSIGWNIMQINWGLKGNLQLGIGFISNYSHTDSLLWLYNEVWSFPQGSMVLSKSFLGWEKWPMGLNFLIQPISIQFFMSPSLKGSLVSMSHLIQLCLQWMTKEFYRWSQWSRTFPEHATWIDYDEFHYKFQVSWLSTLRSRFFFMGKGMLWSHWKLVGVVISMLSWRHISWLSTLDFSCILLILLIDV